jgi:hypothetical protein
MRAAPFLVALLSVASACAAPPSEMMSQAIPSGATVVEVRRADNTATLFQGNSGMTEPARLVIRSDAEWRDAWSRLVGHVSPAPELPAIDFTKEMVLIAAMGSRPTAGHMIHIARVGRVSGVTYVEVVSESPAGPCRQAQVVTAPADVVVVPRLLEPLTFVETVATKGC